MEDKKQLKVLFVTSEIKPFSKTGGLADVSLELPRALKAAGVDVRVITPKYGDIHEIYKAQMLPLSSFGVSVGWRNQYCGLHYLCYGDLPIYFIDNEYYFKRPGCYGYYDDGERFAFFCRAVMESVRHMDDFYPDIIHCNDWQTGIIPVYLRDIYYERPEFKKTGAVFTIHNLKYQGVFAPGILEDLLGLNYGYYNEEKLKFRDGVSFMKAGIVFADKVTTVSETYAKEILSPYYGEGLDGLLRVKEFKLSGILNGIDYSVNNPETDKNLYMNYSENCIEKKLENKLALQRELHLPINPDVPLIGMVTRMVKDKGLELVKHSIGNLLSNDLQIVILGTGDRSYMDFFEYYASAYPGKCSAVTKFDSALASRIYAGSDIFLMPSMFEPCGLSQIIAMRYGSVPVVRETGGLKDTVVPYNEFTGEGNGFSFANFNASEMVDTIGYALRQYRNKEVWKNIVHQAMEVRYDWDTQGKKYIDLYSEIAM